jgi:integrase
MPRAKKESPNRADKRHEVKITIGKALDGKLIRKSFYSSVSKADAKKQADAWRVEQRAYELSGKSYINAEISFKDWAILWLKKYKLNTVKENTYLESYKRTVEKYLIPHFGKFKLTQIKPIDVKSFFQAQNDKYYETTLKKMKLCLNGIFETAIENDLCYKNPCKNIAISSSRESKPKRTYTQAEADEILKLALNHKYGLYIRILLELGLRCSELCGLMWSDFDLINKTVHIKRACTEINGKAVIDKTKNKSSNRILPLSSELIEHVISNLPEDKEQFLIVSRRGMINPITPSKFSGGRYKTFFDDTSIKKRLSPHELRHTCGTLLYARTKDIYAVSKYLGHANVVITSNLYVHEDPEILRDALNII